MFRNQYCGNITTKHIGLLVTCSGWVFRRRDHGGLIFIDLRDISGIVQIVFSPENSPECHPVAHNIRSEYVISITGQVRERPAGTENMDLPTGKMEIYVDKLTILSEADPLPFPIEEGGDASEFLRLKYRYLDLRRVEMQSNLIIRHKTAKIIRDYLDGKGFLEIETPMLTKSTPEGARDYLVPSRLNHGSFYALPQSPQLFKQILMIAGLDKYFQIVKCFRDEDLRADRQPEFTQIDIEMSFINQEDMISLVEGMIKKVFLDILNIEIELPFKRFGFKESMERFGTDKPDLRFNLELKDVSDLIKDSSFKVFLDAINSGGMIKAIRGIGMATYSRKEIDNIVQEAQRFGAKGLAWIKVKRNFESPIIKFFSRETLEQIAQRVEAVDGDIIFFVADKEKVVNEVLSRLRIEFAERLGLIKQGFEFAWIQDFPLFEWNEENKGFKSMHHPFTSPLDEDLERIFSLPPIEFQKLNSQVASIRAKAYDIVLNGHEIGGGSIRIHKKDLQRKIFEILNIREEIANLKFGFLLDALQYGAPPHGGIALGLDRIIMLMVGASSIRDVIAFPKTQKAVCLMSGAPSVVELKQLKDLALKSED